MLKKVYHAILSAALLCPPAYAEEVELKADHPQRYTVQAGDTLWDIAGRFLTKPWLWSQLWQANPQVEDPNLIYPGDVLVLSSLEGKPVLTLERGQGRLGGREHKLSPRVREQPHEAAIQAIPLDAIRPFLSRPRVVSAAQMQGAAYVVSSEDEHLVSGRGARIYARNLPQGEGVRYTVFRQGQAYRDPDTPSGSVLGYEALDVGDAVLLRGGDPAVLSLVRSAREVLAGDRLLPEEEDELPQFIPRPPEREVAGRILSVIDGVVEVGRYEVVVLNLGKDDGIEPGHVLGILQSSLKVRDAVRSEVKEKEEGERRLEFARADTSAVDDLLEHIFNDVRNTKRAIDRKLGVRFNGAAEEVTLPEEGAGEVMVFRSFDKLSYALVMRTTRPVHVGDRVRNP